MPELWIVVPNWERFQHYPDRDPVWIKNYLALLSNEDYLGLAPGTRSILHGVWLAYASSHGQLRLDTRSLSARLRLRVTSSQLESLNQAGFIEVSASKPLALARAGARAGARSQEEEPSVIDKEPPTPTEWGSRELKTNPRALGTNPRALAKRDAPRRKAEAWIANGLAAHYPIEHLPDVLEDEFGITDPELLAELIAKAQPKEIP